MKRREVSNAYVTKMSLKCVSYMRNWSPAPALFVYRSDLPFAEQPCTNMAPEFQQD
jgi:hypothetical protein